MKGPELRAGDIVGENDEVVVPAVAYSYLSRMTDGSRAAVIEVPGFDHECCWTAQWRELAARPELASIPGWQIFILRS